MFKLIIADDELLMRLGIRSMLDWEQHGFRFAGEASNGREALDLALSIQPDLVITDIKMPVLDGLALIREASKALPQCKFVILSNFDEIGYVKEALRLGASDYLIKSEITAEGLAELLAGIRAKLKPAGGDEAAGSVTRFDDSESLAHLKERLFKDLISGLLDEQEASARATQLQLRVRSDRLVVVKLRIDRFEHIRRKYVEKDEKLLRFSVLNVLEEIVPGSRPKEIVVENSADYLLIHNLRDAGEREVRDDISRLCTGIAKTMKDFMNLSISFGVSSAASGFGQLRAAYAEADAALQRRFFAGHGQVFFFAMTDGSARGEAALSGQLELAFRDALEAKDEGRIMAVLDGIRGELEEQRADERTVRDVYIRLTETVNVHLPAAWTRCEDGSRPPYEAVLKAETWADIHRLVTDYVRRTVSASRPVEQTSYADMAAELIHRYYAEDISLQSAAGQINVHPSYLSRVFKQEKGENFVSYLTRIRIERAKALLDHRNLRVYEVADRVGYHNYAYFSKLFKKVVGVSPEEYRESAADAGCRSGAR